MNYIIQRIAARVNPPVVQESNKWADVTNLFDETVLKYWEENTKNATPEKRAEFERAIKRFSELSRRAGASGDPLQQLYYEYRALGIPDGQAKLSVKSYYRREIRNKVYSDTISTIEDGITKSLADTIETATYGNVLADKGIFSSLTRQGSEPERTLEVDDFFTKLFASPLLAEADRIVLVTYLMLGTGPGLRAKKSAQGGGHKMGDGFLHGNSPIDLASVMDNPPKELRMVEEQIEKLIKFGVDPDAITGEKIFNGAYKDDQKKVHMSGLVGGPARVVKAQDNIKKALKSLIGKEDLSDIKKYLIGEAAPDADPKAEEVVDTIFKYLDDEPVTLAQLVPAIVQTVNINIKKKTRLSKSKIFNGSVEAICKKYVAAAQTGKLEDIYKVQDLFMAPVLDNMNLKEI